MLSQSILLFCHSAHFYVFHYKEMPENNGEMDTKKTKSQKIYTQRDYAKIYGKVSLDVVTDCNTIE